MTVVILRFLDDDDAEAFVADLMWDEENGERPPDVPHAVHQVPQLDLAEAIAVLDEEPIEASWWYPHD